MSTNIIQLTPHFSAKEFKCHDGTDIPILFLPNAYKLAQQLEVIRATDDRWINILSGYRTEKHNIRVNGAKHSYHMLCMAADIVKHHESVSLLYIHILELIREKKIINGGVGIYDTFIHYDIRNVSARWDYRTT